MHVFLSLRFRAAADMTAQRLKALEYVAVRGIPWQKAQFFELLEPGNRGALATPADLRIVAAEAKRASRLQDTTASESYSKPQSTG